MSHRKTTAGSTQMTEASDPETGRIDTPPEAPSSVFRFYACQRCTHRKQRCDKRSPVCSNCQASNASCVSSEKEARFVEGTKRESSRKGYVTILLERIRTLEDEVQKQNSLGIEADNSAGRTAEGSSVPSPSSSSPLPASNSAPTVDAPAAVNLNVLALSAVAEPHSRQGEFLQHLSTPRLIIGATDTYGGDPETTDRGNTLWKGISQYIRHPAGDSTHRLRISPEDASQALDVYLDVVDYRLPRLPIAKVRAGLNAITSDNDEHYLEILKSDPGYIFMAYAIVAIAPLISENQPLAQASWVSVHLLGQCLRILDLVFQKEDGVDIIQCLHLLVVLALHCSAAGSAWHLVGFCMSKCVALGYHREDIRVTGPLLSADIQQRRWAFWGCYHIERFICAALGRPSSIDDRDISIPLPSSGQSETDARDSPERLPPLTMKEKFYVHHFHYAILLSLTARDLPGSENPDEGGFDSYIGHALHWRESTPPHDDPSVRQVYLYHTSLFYTLLLRISILDVSSRYLCDEEEEEEETDTDENRLHKPDAVVGGRMRYISARHGDPGAGGHRLVDAARLQHTERAHLRRTKMLDTCSAVARMFDRTRVVGRQYLSLISGYNCLSFALACLYCLVVEGAGETGTLATSSHGPEADFSSEFHSPLPHVFSETPSDVRSELEWQDEYQQLADTYRRPEAILDLACRKLDIVSRQFPRFQEYRTLVERIRYMLKTRHLRLRPGRREAEVKEVKKSIGKIDPIHLRRLAEATVFVLQSQLELQPQEVP